MRHMFKSLAEVAAKPPLTAFGWGVGFHTDHPVAAVGLSTPEIETLRRIGVSRYRINVAWGAMVGADGAVHDEHLATLATTIEQLLDTGIEPMIALDNTAVPTQVVADGGWRNAATVGVYVDFVGAIGARLGHIVDDWLTMASPLVGSEDASIAEHLVAAHVAALVVLRAHCPLGQIGAAVDIRQFDARQSDSARLAADRWLAILADDRTPIDFVALNVDRLGSRRATEIADVVRALTSRTTARSFVLVQVVSTPGQRSRDTRLPQTEAEQRASIVAPAIEQMKTLRSEGIALSGAFTWPFERSADDNLLAVTNKLSSKHRQFAAAVS